MKKLSFPLPRVFCVFLLGALLGCKKKSPDQSAAALRELNLKTGPVITCGPPQEALGTVVFETSCGPAAGDFNRAMSLLHSFEYEEAEKVFAKIIAAQPGCAMAYWGVAMSNFHPLWAPPTEAELRKGAKAVALAQAIAGKSARETAYIAAIGSFYRDWEKVDHAARCVRFEQAMEKLARQQPNDQEAAILWALALTAAADPSDQSFAKQKKAGSILNALYPSRPNHPGVVHYLIHTYDSPHLASLALPAARKYASVAPSSAHALHMPSHIFTRLGLWPECIQSNLASVSSAQCYAEAAGLKGHWDEELHGLDYLMYAYLQEGDNGRAKQQWDYLKTIRVVEPVNFKVAYAFAAIPARYVLENKLWEQAARLPLHPAGFPWQTFPWQRAIVHFTRLLGSVHLGNQTAAARELQELKGIHQQLTEQKDPYKARQVLVQITASEAWLRFQEGKREQAVQLMEQAAQLEDQTEKHPVTPGEIIPARALLADLLLQLNQPAHALEAYQADLDRHPNRFNSLYGAGLAAASSGNLAKADAYYRQLLQIAAPGSTRTELAAARQFLQGHAQ